MRAAPRGKPRGAVVTQESMSARKHRILVVVALAGVALSCVLAWKNLAMQGRIEALETSLKEREGELQSARTPSRVARFPERDSRP